MRSKRLQNRVTIGRITLPIVILLSLVCWIITSTLMSGTEISRTIPSSGLFVTLNMYTWLERLISFLLYTGIGYSLILLNNMFSIIRMRASVQTSIYFMLVAICPFIHYLYAGNLVSAILIASLYFLFKSYQQIHASGILFYTFLCIGIGSLLFPQLTFFAPIFWIGAYQLQSLSFKSFLASFIGWCLPYWFLFGHAYFYDNMELFYRPFRELVTFYPIDWTTGFPLWEIIMLCYLFILYAVSSMHCLMASYDDKIRTRINLNFLILLNFFFFIYILLQPAQSIQMLPLLLVGVSILTGHLFVLTSSRSSNIFFIFTMVGLAGLFGFNIWTLLSNS